MYTGTLQLICRSIIVMRVIKNSEQKYNLRKANRITYHVENA